MDERHEALLDFSIKLDQLVTDFKSKLPHEDGIHLRPQLRKKLKLPGKRKSHKQSVLWHCHLNEAKKKTRCCIQRQSGKEGTNPTKGNL